MNQCSMHNTGFLPMKAGDKILCNMNLGMWPLNAGSKDYYRLDMGNSGLGEVETQQVQISCNSADSVGCNDWFIDPIPVVDADGNTSPGKTRARLTFIRYTHKNTSVRENRGAFYMTFHIHVTRP